MVTFNSAIMNTIDHYMWPFSLERKFDFEEFWYYILQVSVDDMNIHIFPNVICQCCYKEIQQTLYVVFVKRGRAVLMFVQKINFPTPRKVVM